MVATPAAQPIAHIEKLLATGYVQESVSGLVLTDIGMWRLDREQAKKEPPQVVIDFDGIEARLHVVPVPAGNYSDLQVNEKEHVNIPLWAGIGGVIGGALLLVGASNKS